MPVNDEFLEEKVLTESFHKDHQILNPQQTICLLLSYAFYFFYKIRSHCWKTVVVIQYKALAITNFQIFITDMALDWEEERNIKLNVNKAQSAIFKSTHPIFL